MQGQVKVDHCARRTGTKPRHAGQPAAQPAAVAGVLVLLVGPEARGKDTLIAAARNRYAANSRIDFPTRVATRASALDQEHITISRREFQKIETRRGFAVAWNQFGARHGLTPGALHALEAGRVVVLTAPEYAITDFASLACRVEIVTLKSSVDAARPVKVPADQSDAALGCARHQITHTSNIADAVRQFLAVLDTIAAPRAAA